MERPNSVWDNEDILRSFLLYEGPARCNNVESLVKFALEDPVISQWFESRSGFDTLGGLTKLAKYIRDQTSSEEVSSRRDVLRLIFAREVATDTALRLECVAQLMGTIPSVQTAVERAHKLSVDWYSTAGLILPNEFPVRIVEDYPRPYQKNTGSAMAPDKTDVRRYGIAPGIYFRKSKMSVIPSSLIVAHEMVHAFIADKDSELLSRGLEEGICEFFAFVLVGPLLFDHRVVDSLFISKRLKYSGHQQRFQTYMDYFRQASWLYQNFGLEGLVDLLRRGRKEIKQVEIRLTSGSIKEISLDSSEPEEQALLRGQRLALLFPEHEVVSPEAFYLVQQTKDNDLPLSASLQDSALRELQNRIYGVYMDGDGTVQFDDFPTLLASPSFRYEADPKYGTV